MSSTLKISVSQLKIGMYVAQLDRPWLETPFLFQGFYIRDQDDIRELHSYCDYVHILQENSPRDPGLDLGERGRMFDGLTGNRAIRPGKRRFQLPAIFRRSGRDRDKTRERDGNTPPGDVLRGNGEVRG